MLNEQDKQDKQGPRRAAPDDLEAGRQVPGHHAAALGDAGQQPARPEAGRGAAGDARGGHGAALGHQPGADHAPAEHAGPEGEAAARIRAALIRELTELAGGKGYLLEREIADHFRVPVEEIRKALATAALRWRPRLRTYRVDQVADLLERMQQQEQARVAEAV